MKTISLLITLIVFSVSTLFATNIKILFDSAVVAYKNTQYDKALKYFTSIEQQGYKSAYLFYNIGNSYFKLNNIPKAILYYEKALLLKPNDEDINHNLLFANTLITDKINELPKPFYVTWFIKYRNLFSANNWAWIALVSFVLMLSLVFVNLITANILLSRIFKIMIFLNLIIFLLSIFPAYSSYHYINSEQYAIVMKETVEAKSSPDEKGTTLFVIHEGTKVNINEKFEDWIEIKLADGNTGWIKESDVEIIKL